MDVLESMLDAAIEASFSLTVTIFWYLTEWVTGTFVVAIPLFLMVLIVNLVGRRWLTQWARYAVWTLVLIRLVLPVSVVTPISVQTVWSLIKLPTPQSGSLIEDYLLSVSNPTSPVTVIANSPADTQDQRDKNEFLLTLISSCQFSLLLLLWTGTIFVAAVAMFSFHRVFSWMWYSCNCTDQFCLEQVEAARRAYGVNGLVRLLTVHQLASAATFDWLWPTILVPENLALLPEAERKNIIWHEMARLKRGDSGMSLLFTAARVLHWWNPIFWWTQSQWKLERELACDSLTVRTFDQKQTEDYKKTLKQVSNTNVKPPILLMDTPGFVLFNDSQKMLPRRVGAISPGAQSDSRLKCWFSLCVVLVLAATGLTDAAKPPVLPQHDTPIELPAGTEWDDAAEPEKTSEETEVRSYDITEYLARPECRVQPEFWSKHLVQRIDGSIRPIKWDLNSQRTQVPTPTSDENQSSRVEGQQLIIRATAAQHEQIAGLVARWTTNIDTQVTIEVRLCQTKLQLSHLLPANVGKVFNSKAAVNELVPQLPTQSDLPTSGSGTESLQSPLPIFTANLSPDEAQQFIRLAQGDARTNLMFAPKVTLFDGTSCFISDQKKRPFVTGFIGRGLGTQPRITTLDEGMKFEAFALVEGDKVHLRVDVRIATITDVHTRSMKTDSQEFQIQVPELRDITMRFSTRIGDGTTQVLVPLERDPDGQLKIILITPRIIQMEIEEGPAVTPNAEEKPAVQPDADSESGP